MKKNDLTLGLAGEIPKTLQILSNNVEFHDDFRKKVLPRLGKSTASAMVMSQIFADYYTCLETLFLRISQFFENSLQKNKWHKDLLHKMTLSIPGMRKAVISDRTESLLFELLQFRHFRRYYFEMEYDWDRIELVEKKYKRAHLLLKKDMKHFEKFLKALAG